MENDMWIPGDRACDRNTTWTTGQHLYRELKSIYSNYTQALGTDNVNNTDCELENSFNPYYNEEHDPDAEFLIESLIGQSKPSRKATFMPVGVGKTNGVLEMYNKLFPQEQYGFNGRTFVVAALPETPFVIKYPNNTYSGICFEILNALADDMNFRYKVVEPPDGKWGILQDDGNFTGMVGLVQHKVVDFAVGFFSYAEARSKVADFALPMVQDSHVILMKKPDLASSQIFICLSPFSESVWLMIAVSVIVVSLFSWFLSYYHPKSQDISDPKLIFWQTFGALMQQGMVIIPRSGSSRILISFWWLYIIILVGTYNGNLIAFLTAPKVSLPVDSIEDVAKSKSTKFGVQQDTTLHATILYNQQNVFQRLKGKLEKNLDDSLLSNPDDGIARLLTQKDYVLLVSKLYYDAMGSRSLSEHMKIGSCEISRAKEAFLNIYQSFLFQKDSPHLNQMNVRIQYLKEGGLIDYWVKKYSAMQNSCSGLERTEEQRNISLAEAQGAFYILGIGIVTGLVFLLTEFTKKRLECSVCTTNNKKSVSMQSNNGGILPHAEVLADSMSASNSKHAEKRHGTSDFIPHQSVRSRDKYIVGQSTHEDLLHRFTCPSVSAVNLACSCFGQPDTTRTHPKTKFDSIQNGTIETYMVKLSYKQNTFRVHSVENNSSMRTTHNNDTLHYKPDNIKTNAASDHDAETGEIFTKL